MTYQELSRWFWHQQRALDKKFAEPLSENLAEKVVRLRNKKEAKRNLEKEYIDRYMEIASNEETCLNILKEK